ERVADAFGGLTLVEARTRAVRGEPLERAGEVRLPQEVALARRVAAWQEDACRPRVPAQHGHVAGGPICERAADRHAVPRVADRVLEQRVPVEPAVSLVRLAPAVHGAGHGQRRGGATVWDHIA